MYSTIDHIYTLITMISNCLYGRRRSKLYIAFIDYQKAFDTVDRNKLWNVLKKMGISTKMLQMLQGIYKSVQACVRSGNELTDLFECPLGVKQGCLLLPLIFSLLISEVAEKVTQRGRQGYQFLPGTEELFIILFVDDVVLLARTPAGLQNQLNNLKSESENLRLTVNLQKNQNNGLQKGRISRQSRKMDI